MRVALAPAGKTGLRAGRALLSEEGLTELGVLGARARSADPRVTEIADPDGWDLLLTDARSDDARLANSTADLVLVTTEPLSERFPGPCLSLASWSTGLMAAVAFELLDDFEHVVTVDASRTSVPARIRKRASAHFPAPIGPQWHEPIASPVTDARGVSFHQAPYDGELVGIAVRAEGDIEGRRTTVTRGVVEDPDFLAAIALAGAAKTVIDNGGWEQRSEVSEQAALYLRACQELGLEMATFRAAS